MNANAINVKITDTINRISRIPRVTVKRVESNVFEVRSLDALFTIDLDRSVGNQFTVACYLGVDRTGAHLWECEHVLPTPSKVARLIATHVEDMGYYYE